MAEPEKLNNKSFEEDEVDNLVHCWENGNQDSHAEDSSVGLSDMQWANIP